MTSHCLFGIVCVCARALAHVCVSVCVVIFELHCSLFWYLVHPRAHVSTCESFPVILPSMSTWQHGATLKYALFFLDECKNI